MESYQEFAEVYDHLMNNVDYDAWAESVDNIIKKHGAPGKRLLELACGTGNMTLALVKREYFVTGTDISPAMLAQAKMKAHHNGYRIPFMVQDMTALNYSKKVDIVASFCDGFNYLLSEDDLTKAFQSVAGCLKDDGLFIFDLSSEYKLSTVLGNNTIAESREDVAFIWDNHYEAPLLTFDLSLFIEEEENYFRKEVEHHTQRSYSVECVRALLPEGMSLLATYDGEALGDVHEKSERITFVIRKERK